MSQAFDLLILGAGPAGLSAGLYGSRAGLSVAVLEKGVSGGQITLTAEVENYPGQMPEGEDGFSLTDRMAKQCERFGVTFIRDTIVSVDLSAEVKLLRGAKDSYEGRALIIATGADPRPIGCPHEADYIGKGISYCATCDANFFRGLPVFVVGGGDAAVEEAVFLTKFASKVTIIHRRNELRAVKAIRDRAFANEKIDFIWDSVIEDVGGENLLSALTLRNVRTGEIRTIEADPAEGMFGVFVFLGRVPNTALFKDSGLALDEYGYIPTDEKMRTNLPGVFAAGDVRTTPLRQVVTAAADGAVAATVAEKELGESNGA